MCGNASQSFLVMITGRFSSLSLGKRGKAPTERCCMGLGAGEGRGTPGRFSWQRQPGVDEPSPCSPVLSACWRGPTRAARGAEAPELALSPAQNLLAACHFQKMCWLPPRDELIPLQGEETRCAGRRNSTLAGTAGGGQSCSAAARSRSKFGVIITKET